MRHIRPYDLFESTTSYSGGRFVMVEYGYYLVDDDDYENENLDQKPQPYCRFIVDLNGEGDNKFIMVKSGLEGDHDTWRPMGFYSMLKYSAGHKGPYEYKDVTSQIFKNYIIDEWRRHTGWRSELYIETKPVEDVIPDRILNGRRLIDLLEIMGDIYMEARGEIYDLIVNKGESFSSAALRFITSKTPEEMKAPVLSRIDPSHLDEWIKRNPLDLDLLDEFPEIKAGVIQRTGIKDISKLARLNRSGLL